MSPNKGIGVREIEREFVRLGGTVDRSRPDHVQFKYPGLPTVGVHCNRTRAPRRLVSLFRKVLAGKVVTTTRAHESEVSVAETKTKLIKLPIRPNPPKPLTTAAPVSQEVVRAAVEDMERQKTCDRTAALARIFIPAPTPRPHEAPFGPLVWHPGNLYFDKSDYRRGAEFLAIQLGAFTDAERDGLVRWWTEPFGWLEEMELWLIPEKHRSLPREGSRFGIAVTRPGPYGFRRHHTYVVKRVDAVIALVTVDPPEYARFRARWDIGVAYIRRYAIRMGSAAEIESVGE